VESFSYWLKLNRYEALDFPLQAAPLLQMFCEQQQKGFISGPSAALH
jgi:hypothetical protein